MASYPTVSFNVDMSTGSTSATATAVPAPTEPTYSLCMSIARFNVFTASGFKYQITTDASGITTSVSALAFENISSTYFATIAAGSATKWRNKADLTDAINKVYTVEYLYDTVSKTTGLSTDTIFSLLPSANNLGEHILLLATTSVLGKNPTSTTQVFASAEKTAKVQEINTNIANAVKAALSTQECQDALFQTILQANGPVTETLTASNATEIYYLPYSTAYTPMRVILTITNFPITLSMYGQTHNLVLKNIPLKLLIG